MTRLIGIYEADGSLLGELSYVVGKLFGRRHCALCDITHGAVSKKATFAALEARLPWPIELLHLDERTPAQREASEGHTPCVLLEDEAGLRVVLSKEQLEGCGGDVDCFGQLVGARLMLRLSRWAVSSYETEDDLAQERAALAPHVEVVDREEDAEIVVVTSSRRLDAELLARAPSAKLVITTTSGYDHLDLEAIVAHGAVAARSPLARRDAVVEHTLRHLMRGLHHIPRMTEAARDGRWLRPELPALAPRSLGDATVGVVGCGVIGRRAIEWLHMMGATVVASDPAGVPAGVPAWPVERMVAEADAVTLHCHLTPQTRGMVNDAWLASADDLVFVNTARGKLVDLDALRAALAAGRLRYAGLDVFPAEPPPELASLARHPAVGVSPHSAGYSVGLAERVRAEMVTTTAAYARGEALPHPIALP